MGPLRSQAESCLSQLRVIGKDSIFEDCPMEKQLAEFVKARTMLGLTTTDGELQVEACNAVGRMEESSVMPSEDIANLLLRLIHKDSSWLSSFRQRAGLPAAGASLASKESGQSPQEISGTSDSPLNMVDSLISNTGNPLGGTSNLVSASNSARGTPFFGPSNTASPAGPPSANVAKWSHWFMNGSGCYRQLARELSRFVASATSPNNPNQHVPTDQELQHQARWILYDE